MNRIAATALIEDGVELGDDNLIEHGVIIRAGSKLGNGNRIGPGALIGPRVEMGDGNQVDFQACLGGAPQAVGQGDPPSRLVIGSRNVFREFVTANRGLKADGVTRVGDDNYIMSYCHLAHDVVVGNGNVFASYAGLSGHVWIGDHVVLGGMAGLHQFVRVGSHAMVSGLAKPTKDAPPFALVEHRPALVIGLNSVGLKRAGFSPAERKEIKEIFRVFYLSGLPFSKAAGEIERLFPGNPRAEMFLEFFRGSERGLMRHAAPRKALSTA